jgi:hypothetical protein
MVSEQDMAAARRFARLIERRGLRVNRVSETTEAVVDFEIPPRVPGESANRYDSVVGFRDGGVVASYELRFPDANGALKAKDAARRAARAQDDPRSWSWRTGDMAGQAGHRIHFGPGPAARRGMGPEEAADTVVRAVGGYYSGAGGSVSL